MTALWIVLGLATAIAQEPEAAPAPPPQVSEADALAPLEAAYQKEYAYLTAEKSGLERRIADQEREGSRVRSENEATLDRLEARLTALQVQVERSTALLEDVERRALTAQEADDALEAAWFQLRNTLEADGPALPEVEPTYESRAAGFGEGFARAATAVADGARIRTRAGSWFALDGTQVEGTLVEVGRIATYGVAGTSSVALLPVGEGRLQAYREGGSTGAALTSGAPAPSMGLYLHEGRTKRIEERDPKTVEDILEAGGTVGYVIVGIGVLALLLAFARLFTLVAAGRDRRAVDVAFDAIEEGRIAEALRMLDGRIGTSARVLAAMLPRLESPRKALEDIANEAILRETPRVERFGSAILVIAAVAPLLGLLGTVTGMIATFDIITEFGTGDPRMLSGGISAALVTTQFGLIVAIPSLLAGNLLSGWGEQVLDGAEGAALRLLNLLDDEEGDREPEPLAQASK